MKNKITSLILVAALALMANIAGMGLMADTVGNSNGSDEILLCYDEPEFSEF